MAGRAIRHHIIPRFFLKRFTDASGQLLVRDDETGREFQAMPVALAVELDFYTVETASGPSDAIEKALGVVESKTAEALRRIDDGAFPPSEADRGAIASFMALQFVRGKDFRAMGDRGATDLMRMVGKISAAHPDYIRATLPKALGRAVTEDEVQRVIAGLERGDGTVTLPREQHIETMLYVANESFRYFYLRKWFLVEGKDFPSSDLPVVLWQRPRSGFFQGVGAMTADEIAIAIGPTRALVLVHPDEATGNNSGPERRVTLSAEKEAQLRERLWVHARRYHFRNPASPAPAAAALTKAVDAEATTVSYFAYGSNMSIERIGDRVRKFGPLAPGRIAHLARYKRTFDKPGTKGAKTNLRKTDDPSDVVPGVLFTLTATQFDSLAKHEVGYATEHVQVVLDDGVQTDTTTFIAKERRSVPVPRELLGAADHRAWPLLMRGYSNWRDSAQRSVSQ